MRTPQQDVKITINSGGLLDLLQSEDSSLIFCSVKPYKASIGLQASSLLSGSLIDYILIFPEK